MQSEGNVVNFDSRINETIICEFLLQRQHHLAEVKLSFQFDVLLLACFWICDASISKVFKSTYFQNDLALIKK